MTRLDLRWVRAEFSTGVDYLSYAYGRKYFPSVAHALSEVRLTAEGEGPLPDGLDLLSRFSTVAFGTFYPSVRAVSYHQPVSPPFGRPHSAARYTLFAAARPFWRATPHDALLAAALAGDRTALGALADRFEEEGDPRAGDARGAWARAERGEVFEWADLVAGLVREKSAAP